MREIPWGWAAVQVGKYTSGSIDQTRLDPTAVKFIAEIIGLFQTMAVSSCLFGNVYFILLSNIYQNTAWGNCHLDSHCLPGNHIASQYDSYYVLVFVKDIIGSLSGLMMHAKNWQMSGVGSFVYRNNCECLAHASTAAYDCFTLGSMKHTYQTPAQSPWHSIHLDLQQVV